MIGSRKGEGLSDEELEYVGLLEQSLKKVEDMQGALLTFSRLNTRASEPVEIDCNEIWAEALKELSDKVKPSNADVTCGDLPTITAEPKHIQMLFVNLLDNALKFHASEDSERIISMSAMEQDDQWLFELKDNGIGIAEDYQEAVFSMFRRLNPASYKGIGSGLTIARKIVNDHGGDMLIESEPENGTSVFFTLPRA